MQEKLKSFCGNELILNSFKDMLCKQIHTSTLNTQAAHISFWNTSPISMESMEQ